MQLSLWIVRRKRPFSICEDEEFRDVFDNIFKGGYIPPCHKLVNQHVLSLSTEGRAKVCSALKDLFDEGISPCIAGDIWSEGGVAIFGILVYWLSADGEYIERLLGALPFSAVRHTGDELELATKRACASMGIGTFIEGDSPVDIVSDSVHATTSDSASNIVSGWKCFDGHECNCHIIALAVTKYLESPGVGRLFRKLRGMTTHFNHSVIGRHLLHDCQTRYQLSLTSPPQDNSTRGGWKGAYLMAEWYFQNQVCYSYLPAVTGNLRCDNWKRSTCDVITENGALVMSKLKTIELKTAWGCVRTCRKLYSCMTSSSRRRLPPLLITLTAANTASIS